jgi:Domain of unknown function (DUF4397)
MLEMKRMIAPLKQTAARILSITAAFLMAACSRSSLPSETTVDGVTSEAPSAAAARQQQKTLVRFINATQGPKDLYFQDMPAFTKLAFGGVTPYITLVDPHQDVHHELKLYNSSSEVGTPLTRNSEVETSGHRYTVLALNQDGKPRLSVIPDQLKPPASGKTKVRLIHAAPGVDQLDIFRAGETNGIFNGQSFASVTEYKEIEPVTTELEVRKRGSKTNEVKLKDVKLEAGKLYTIILLGGEGKPLSCEVIEDELVPVAPLR